MVLLVGVAGKRFTGKDTLSHAIHKRLADKTTSEIGTISMPFKKQFAEKFGHDYARLLNDREYKEQRREEMINYFHELEKEDPLIDEKWWCELLNTCPSRWKVTSGVDSDKTETDLDEFMDWDYEVINDGTMDSINSNADKIVDLILAKINSTS